MLLDKTLFFIDLDIYGSRCIHLTALFNMNELESSVMYFVKLTVTDVHTWSGRAGSPGRPVFILTINNLIIRIRIS